MATDEPDFGDWGPFFDEMSEAYREALQRNVDAQRSLFETWADSMDVDDESIADGIEGYAAAYEVWMNAAEEAANRTEDALGGEEVGPEEFRDIWLNASNKAFKQVMQSSAFAAATGQSVEGALDIQGQLDEATQDTLDALGFATGRDVREVGERLVELERRQQRVEDRLDQILDAVEEE
ncbi:MAG: poly(R)-hydroxyalkanoic acid synthase subunit [Halobacteriaceae archaeon]